MNTPLATALSRAAIVLSLWAAGCGESPKPATTGGAGSSALKPLVAEILEDNFKRHPSNATYLGVHKYDAQLDNFSAAGFEAEAASDSAFRARLVAVDTAGLALEEQLDREQLIHVMDAGILANRVVKAWAKNPDTYSSGITNAAYVIMERPFAPAADRLTSLIAREEAMPAALAEARKNLVNPPKVFTQIAIEQIDGNVSFFKNDVPAAFKDVSDTALVSKFKKSNAAVM